MARNHAVTGDQLVTDAEVAAAVRDQLVDFFEAAGIEQEIDPLAGRQFPGVVLPPRARLAAALLGKSFECAQSIDGRESSEPPSGRSVTPWPSGPSPSP